MEGLEAACLMARGFASGQAHIIRIYENRTKGAVDSVCSLASPLAEAHEEPKHCIPLEMEAVTVSTSQFCC